MARYYEGVSDDRMLDLFRQNYLMKRGWLASVAARESVDLSGPTPWYTYPAKAMIERIVRPHWAVFEFGSGNSTLWWAANSAEVVSVEHDLEWSAFVRTRLPDTSATLIEKPPGATASEKALALFANLGASHGLRPFLTGNEASDLTRGLVWEPYYGYVATLVDHPPGHFDIVVVDGMARGLAAAVAALWVKPSGIIVFDNSDRAIYQPGYDFLRQEGFARIDFWGPGPVNPYEWCTSFFVRELDAFR